MTIAILLADDQCVMLEGIKAILKHEPEIEIVGTARDGCSAIAQSQKLQPDIVLMDIDMPKMNGIAATKYICQHQPNTKVIVLTSHRDRDYISRAFQAGASGYLLKESLIEDLKQAIYSLDRGYCYIEAKLLAKAIDKTQKVDRVKYQKKFTYLKKYRKSVYTPSSDTLDKLPSLNNSRPRSNPSVIEASLTPVLHQTAANSAFLTAATPKNLRPSRLPKIHRRTDRQRVTWLIMAIASLILSIIIF